MKGLLHRLAARAAGSAVPVRADARLSLGGVGLGWADAGEQAASMGLQAAPTMPPGEPVAPLAPAYPRELASRDQAGGLPFSSMFGPVTQPPGDAAPAAPGLFEPRQARPGEPPLLRAAPAQIPPLEPGQGGPTRSSALTFEAIPRRTLEASSTPATPILRPSSESWGPALATSGPPLPPPLRPAASPAQTNFAFAVPKVPHSPPGATRQGGAASGDDLSEVHIHIGRIDVTAVPDAPQRRAPTAGAARAAPAPMSLDAYLARRSRS